MASQTEQKKRHLLARILHEQIYDEGVHSAACGGLEDGIIQCVFIQHERATQAYLAPDVYGASATMMITSAISRPSTQTMHRPVLSWKVCVQTADR